MQKENGRVYEGSEPYIFISYAHKDSAKMLPIIRKLQQIGFRIWFDEGIEAGSEWPEYVAEHLLNSSCVLAFITKNAVESPNCRQEINFAIDEGKPLLVIHLEETTLTPGMRMRLNSHQQMFYNRHADVETFVVTLSESVLLKVCKIASEDASKEVTESTVSEKKPLSTVQSVTLPKETLDTMSSVALQEETFDTMSSVALQEETFDTMSSVLLQEETFDMMSSILLQEETLDETPKKEPDWTKILSYSVNGNCAVITGLKDKNCSEIIIPSKIEGKPVRAISKEAFYACKNLRSVEISEGLHDIGSKAFSKCSLYRVAFPKSLKTIGPKAFASCDWLTSVRFPGGLTEIGSEAFASCKCLTSVKFPEGLTEIGSFAFYLCEDLRSVKFPESLKKIGAYAFQCTRLKSVELPKGLVGIGVNAFDSHTIVKKKG